jgi:hypothetical protein
MIGWVCERVQLSSSVAMADIVVNGRRIVEGVSFELEGCTLQRSDCFMESTTLLPNSPDNPTRTPLISSSAHQLISSSAVSPRPPHTTNPTTYKAERTHPSPRNTQDLPEKAAKAPDPSHANPSPHLRTSRVRNCSEMSTARYSKTGSNRNSSARGPVHVRTCS